MKKIVVVLACLFAGSLVSMAEEKEVTLKGDLVCSKCILKATEKCGSALQVKEGDKTTNYMLENNDVCKKVTNDLWEKDKINWCEKSTPMTAVGTVKEADGKKTLAVTKLKKVKKEDKKAK